MVYFSSKGTGDLNIQAEIGSLLSEIYAITDYHIYRTDTYSTSSSTQSEIISGYSFPNNGDWEIYADTMVTANSMRWEIGSTSTYKYGGLGINGAGYVRAFQGNGSNAELSTSTHGTFTKNSWIPLKIVRDGTDFKYYYNGSLIETLSVSSWISSVDSFPLFFNRWGSSGTLSVKNLKVKPL